MSPDLVDDPLPAPASAWDLFKAFTVLALQGFGGVLAVAQRELVERRRWISREHFVEMLSISQVLPGPNIVNLALMFGDRFFGFRGGFAALGGMLAVPMLIVIALTVSYSEFAHVPIVSGALRGMGAVAAGLVVSTAVKLLDTLRTSRLGVAVGALFVVLTVIAIAVLRWPLIGVLLGFGAVAVALAWVRSHDD